MGVGVTYTSALDELIIENPGLFEVVEIEPQTVWMETGRTGQPFRVPAPVLEKILGLPGKKLVHSIGVPVGGSVPADVRQFALLKEMIRLLGSPYASEHLSFNASHGFNTGFFLPPRQTDEGVGKAVESILRLRDAIGVPLAIETGVNYLRRRGDEMTDGEFVAQVAEKADCAILLDLHNIFANQLNGRQSVAEFISQLPLDRVWEIHLAGGFERDGYYLDSHSGEISADLFKLSKEIVEQIPNLKTIIFEIFPSFLPLTGTELVKNEVEKLALLWNRRGTRVRQQERIRSASVESVVTPDDWEHAVASLSVGGEPVASSIYAELENDPAIPVIQKLITEFRGSMLVALFPMSCRLMVLTLTEAVFMTILRDFWSKHPPKQFATAEADSFYCYMEKLGLKLPSLAKVLEFERAVMHTLGDDKARLVAFDFNPFPLLESLAEKKLPEREAELGNYEIEITPEVYNDLTEKGSYTFPFH